MLSVDTRCAVAEVRVRHLEVHQAAFVAALDALVTEMDQEHADHYFARKLAAIVATYRDVP